MECLFKYMLNHDTTTFIKKIDYPPLNDILKRVFVFRMQEAPFIYFIKPINPAVCPAKQRDSGHCMAVPCFDKKIKDHLF